MSTRSNFTQHYQPPTTRIEAIKTTPHGEKLIAFSRVHYYPACKPQVSPCVFASYDVVNCWLRIYNRSDYVSYRIPGFKNALTWLRKEFTDY